MIVDSFVQIFTEDLDALKKEVELYKSEESLWAISKGISNSGGNLCLHLVGNLNTYIGVELGKTTYVRRRDLEFSLKNIPREILLEQIDNVQRIVKESLNNVVDEHLNNLYPVKKYEPSVTLGYMLIHLANHLRYHLGQINYHRRLIDA